MGSQIRTVVSIEGVASHWPLGDQAGRRITSSWPRRRQRSLSPVGATATNNRPLLPVAGIAPHRYKQLMMVAQNSLGMATVSLPDLAATQVFAARLAAITRPGDVIALTGDLGMGKTAFARAFINGLAAQHGLPMEEVPSPTFTLVQTYPMPDFMLYHIDLYRLERPEEALELGIEEAFDGNVTLIEWPDRLGPLLPAERLDITLLPGDTEGARQAKVDFGELSDNWRDRLNDRVLHG